MASHTVKPGEHLSGIALRYGFSNYRTVWEDAGNKQLRELRKNPHVLLPGDVVHIPSKTPKEVSKPTTQRHIFHARVKPLKLRLALRDYNGDPIANTPCTLKIGDTKYELKTNADGILEHPVRKTDTSAVLRIQGRDIQLQIGHLDPHDAMSGWRARLNNLGYHAGNSDDPDDPRLRAAIEEFQCDQGLTVDGKCGPATQAALLKAHKS